MKPKIKDVQLQVREFPPDGFKRCVTICRWSGFSDNLKVQNFSAELYSTVTPASAGRILRAQEAMLSRGQA